MKTVLTGSGTKKLIGQGIIHRGLELLHCISLSSRVVVVFVSPFAFWAIKKWGRGFVALIGTGVACAGWLLVSFAENEVVFLSAKALLGGGFGMMYIASVSAVNVAFDRHRSKALALGCTFSAVGQVVMSGLASYLLGSGGLG